VEIFYSTCSTFPEHSRQRRPKERLESLFNTAYGVVKAGKPFSDYELICEIQVKNGLDLGENNRNINGCKTFAASIAQTLVDKQVQFQILSYNRQLLRDHQVP
jgi:hypothetical protein